MKEVILPFPNSSYVIYFTCLLLKDCDLLVTKLIVFLGGKSNFWGVSIAPCNLGRTDTQPFEAGLDHQTSKFQGPMIFFLNIHCIISKLIVFKLVEVGQWFGVLFVGSWSWVQCTDSSLFFNDFSFFFLNYVFSVCFLLSRHVLFFKKWFLIYLALRKTYHIYHLSNA